jgi:predicted nucleic acid-binding protein
VADAIVDASVWVSLFVAHDAHHTTTARWLAAAAAREELLAGPALVLAEVAGPIARMTGSARLARRAIAQMQRVRRVRLVAVDQALAEAAARLAADRRLRGADAVYVALAQRLDLPLVTLDAEQLARGAAVVDARRPS